MHTLAVELKNKCGETCCKLMNSSWGKTKASFIEKFWRQWPTFWQFCEKSGSGDWRLQNVGIDLCITDKNKVASYCGMYTA